ncbi:MAG: ABC transporter ATP-binding protein [Armatimonadota bacterium]
MSETVIRVEGLGKRYRIGALRQGAAHYKTLQEAIKWRANRLKQAMLSRLTAPVIPAAGTAAHGQEDFWALRNVSFEVKQGEVVGVIGRNGAGKSTLLKVLSRITEPTEGWADIYGRIGSLLEVGTGFHPELTGRENIYLNGAILGMRKAEIDRKFDEIVAFSEIEKFLDTPVKRYSSGMYVRLAFAVAAHLEPEILLVDEILAVGDVQFQKKCLGKMNEVARGGKTVLFVSHNIHVISELCDQCILLDQGTVKMAGPTHDVVSHYMTSGEHLTSEKTWSLSEAPGTQNVKLLHVRALNQQGAAAYDMPIDQPITLEMEFQVAKEIPLHGCFTLHNSEGLLVCSLLNGLDQEWGQRIYQPGRYRLWCTIPASLLNDGIYTVSVFLHRDRNAGPVEVGEQHVIIFNVVDTGSTRGGYAGNWVGVVRPILPWGGDFLGDR